MTAAVHARRLRPATALLAALSLLALAIGAAAHPAPAFAAGLPECRYDDVMTEHTAYNQWRYTLLDTIYMLPSSYKPGNLVSVGQANISGSGSVRRGMIDDLAALAAGAREANNPLRVVSAFRSYSQQAALFRREVDRFGLDRARSQVARPGHSEHQLGTTIDFGSAGSGAKPWSNGDWAQTPAGSWMKQNGWRYGFVLSYPKGKKALTCYRYEPWHWRYVGREMAADMHGTGLTLREYIWQHYH
jgi:D-alanyl-D-alanine carboxypeptidase